jgi:hypothetical protein
LLLYREVVVARVIVVVDTWTLGKMLGSKGWSRNSSNAYVAILIVPSLHVGVVSVEGVGCSSGGDKVDSLPLVVLVGDSDEVDPFLLGGKHQLGPNTLVLQVFF